MKFTAVLSSLRRPVILLLAMTLLTLSVTWLVDAAYFEPKTVMIETEIMEIKRIIDPLEKRKRELYAIQDRIGLYFKESRQYRAAVNNNQRLNKVINSLSRLNSDGRHLQSLQQLDQGESTASGTLYQLTYSANSRAELLLLIEALEQSPYINSLADIVITNKGNQLQSVFLLSMVTADDKLH